MAVSKAAWDCRRSPADVPAVGMTDKSARRLPKNASLTETPPDVQDHRNVLSAPHRFLRSELAGVAISTLRPSPRTRFAGAAPGSVMLHILPCPRLMVWRITG